MDTAHVLAAPVHVCMCVCACVSAWGAYAYVCGRLRGQWAAVGQGGGGGGSELGTATLSSVVGMVETSVQ